MNEIIEAIKANEPKKVAALLDRDPALLKERDGKVTAVLLALYHGRRDIAQLFVDRGAQLSFPEACAYGDEAKVRKLLERDPSLANSFSDDGYPSVGLAIFFRQPAIAKLLIERGADVNAAARNPQKVAPIHAAATTGDREMVRLLLEKGANANARQDRGYVAIHTAALHGDVEMGKILVEHGADPKLAADDGKTAESLAAEKGRTEFLAWLRIH